MHFKFLFSTILLFFAFFLNGQKRISPLREGITRDTLIININSWLNNGRLFFSYIKFVPNEKETVSYKDDVVFYVSSKTDSIVRAPFEMKVLKIYNFPRKKRIDFLDDTTSVSYTFLINDDKENDFYKLENFKEGEIIKKGTIIGYLKNSSKNAEKKYKFHPLMVYYNKKTNTDEQMFFYKSKNKINLILDW